MTAFTDADADIRAAAPPLVAVLGGRVALVLGVFTVLLGAQSLGNLRFVSWYWLLPLAMLPLGVASVISGWKLSRGRGWAAIAVVALAGFLGLFVSGWTLLALTFGYFSMLSPMVAMAAFVAALLAGLAIGPCRRADAARAKLLSEGLDLGV
jgi:hypothetical protein